jgi:hypothetical protein
MDYGGTIVPARPASTSIDDRGAGVTVGPYHIRTSSEITVRYADARRRSAGYTRWRALGKIAKFAIIAAVTILLLLVLWIGTVLLSGYGLLIALGTAATVFCAASFFFGARGRAVLISIGAIPLVLGIIVYLVIWFFVFPCAIFSWCSVLHNFFGVH